MNQFWIYSHSLEYQCLVMTFHYAFMMFHLLSIATLFLSFFFCITSLCGQFSILNFPLEKQFKWILCDLFFFFPVPQIRVFSFSWKTGNQSLRIQILYLNFWLRDFQLFFPLPAWRSRREKWYCCILVGL